MANDWVCQMPIPEAGDSYIVQMGTVELSGDQCQLVLEEQQQEEQLVLSKNHNR